MLNRPLKVLIACGSGCCTSTHCKNIITELAKEEKIPVEITTCSSLELAGISKNFEVHFTTMPYKFPEGTKYCLNVFPLVTNMRVEKCKEDIKIILHDAHDNL